MYHSMDTIMTTTHLEMSVFCIWVDHTNYKTSRLKNIGKYALEKTS